MCVQLLFSEALGGDEAMLYGATCAVCSGTQDLELVLQLIILAGNFHFPDNPPTLVGI